MRLIIRPGAPSALKVTIFVAECGRAIETVDAGDLEPPELLRMNPFGTVPVLETDGGRFVSESLTICEYLDQIWGGVPLFGATDEERLQVRMWERRAELQLFIPAIDFGHHSHKMFAGVIAQHPEWARATAERSRRMLDLMEDRLGESRWLAGDTFSMADITAFLGYSAFLFFGAFAPAQGALGRWAADVGERPSFAPLRALTAQMS
jgi:glutathione S-transferase